MILVDRELERREADGKPIRVAMVGAGFMGRAIALQIETATPGMKLVAIANRTLERAHEAYALAGIETPVEAGTDDELAKALRAGSPAVTSDPLLVADAEGIEVPEAALALIARAAEGSMRDAQSAFDQVIAFAGNTIGVDDVDAMCAELAARGVTLLNGPMDRPWGIRTASFRDPAGHIWEIAR